MLGQPKKVEHFVKPVTKEFICEPCKKSFKTQNSYKSHLRLSKVHQYPKKIDKADVIHQQVPINSEQSEQSDQKDSKRDLDKEAKELIDQMSHLSSAGVIKLFNQLYNEKLSDKEKLKAEKEIQKEKVKAEKALKKAEIEKEKETKRKLKMEAYSQYTNLLKNEKVQALLKGINNVPKSAYSQVVGNSEQSKTAMTKDSEKVTLSPPDKKVQPKAQPSLMKENGTTYVVVKDEVVEEVENLDDRLFKSKKQKKYKPNEINLLTGLPVKPKTRINNSGVIEQYYE